MGLDTPQSKVNAKISAPSFPPRFSRQPALLSVHSHAAPASLHQWAPSSAPHRWCRRWAWEGDGSLQPSLLHSTSVTLTSSLFPPHQFSPSSLCSYRGLWNHLHWPNPDFSSIFQGTQRNTSSVSFKGCLEQQQCFLCQSLRLHSAFSLFYIFLNCFSALNKIIY